MDTRRKEDMVCLLVGMKKKYKKYKETKETRNFVMKMKTWFKVIVNSNEGKNRNQAMKEWEKKNQGRAYQERNEQTLFVNCINETTLCQNQRSERKKKDLKQIWLKIDVGVHPMYFHLWRFHLSGFRLHVFILCIINMYNIIFNSDNILLNMNMRNNRLNRNHAHW